MIVPLEQQLSYSLRRQYLDEFLSRTIVGTGDPLLLDIGGVTSRRRGKFDIHQLGWHVYALNITTAKQIDVRADASYLPIGNRCVDWVLCSEVLEHVWEPWRLCKEAHRVLRSEGCFVATIPFLFRLHADPVDIGRYSPQILKHQLENIGFKDIHIEKHGLFWSVSVDMVRDWLRFLVVSKYVKYKFATRLFSRIVSFFRRKAFEIDTRESISDHEFFGNYVGGFGIIARKP